MVGLSHLAANYQTMVESHSAKPTKRLDFQKPTNPIRFTYHQL